MDTVQPQPVDNSSLASLRRYLPQRVRWTFWDLLIVALITVVISGLSVVVLRAVLPATGLDLRSVAVNLGANGTIYLAVVVAVLVGIVLRQRGTWREIGFRRTSPWWALLVLGIFTVQIVSLAGANLLVQRFTGPFVNPQIAELTDGHGFSWLNFAVVFVVGAIIAPIVEEMTFRGLLYQWLRSRAGIVVAVVVTAALFAAAHRILPLFPAFFLISVIFALAFEWSQSLWVTIALHMLQNSLAIIALYALQASGIQLPR